MDRVVIRWQAMAVACVLIVALFAAGLWSNARDLRTAQERETAMQEELTHLQEIELELSAELEKVGTASYIEARAREDYAFLKPGELRFEVINPKVLEGYTREELQILMDEITMY
ncbi:MAG: septum formation initiator family protein [Aristaeellaceae bacterium]